MFEIQVHGTVIKVYWVAGVLFIAAVFLIVSLIKRAMLKSTIQSFNNGITDITLLEKCEKQKKFYRFANTAIIHDLLCCMVAAIALVHNDQNQFIDNICQIKAVCGDTEHRIRLLLLAYLTEQRYIDLSLEYQKRCPDQKGNMALLLQMYNERKADEINVQEKIHTLDKILNRQEILDILHSYK